MASEWGTSPQPKEAIMNIMDTAFDREYSAWENRHRSCQHCGRRHTMTTVRGTALCQPCAESGTLTPIVWSHKGLTEANIAAIQEFASTLV